MCPDNILVGALLTSRPQHTSLLEALPRASCVVDDTEKVVDANTSAQAVTGGIRSASSLVSRLEQIIFLDLLSSEQVRIFATRDWDT
ncbi:hypothetical protein [Ktedonobacter racemifer]|uniref:Uncharacterized protein n=1 Tax=Ktedonobacter racemifer DSM 44963 TaxID=485913 RepID=D6U8A5_KTERA|nr:hypothetical protein [Ktedonobacter racemifer]EFH80116.1 hypothetical protein Krac_0670 [Ktedonobacter racemifer DSM 44963]